MKAHQAYRFWKPPLRARWCAHKHDLDLVALRNSNEDTMEFKDY
jgi:hypothetical protein